MKERLEKIREKLKELRHKFPKSKINEIRKNFYEIENENNLSAPKEIEKYLLEQEKNPFKSKKLWDYYDDAEYQGIKSIRNLSIDKDYKPVIIDGVFNNNYVQYESIGSGNLSIKEYLDKIKPYLSDLINNHKAQRKT